MLDAGLECIARGWGLLGLKNDFLVTSSFLLSMPAFLFLWELVAL